MSHLQFPLVASSALASLEPAIYVAGEISWLAVDPYQINRMQMIMIRLYDVKANMSEMKSLCVYTTQNQPNIEMIIILI